MIDAADKLPVLEVAVDDLKDLAVAKNERMFARDAAIVLSFALQHRAYILVIGRALCRDSRGTPSGVIGAALDIIAGEQAKWRPVIEAAKITM